MRMMMRARIPVKTGNAAIADGTIQKMIGEFMADCKPEAAYFTVEAGVRTAYFFVEMKDASDMPALGERLLFGLEAALDIIPVMTAQDLMTGLSKLSPNKS